MNYFSVFFSVLYNNTAQEQHFLILMSGFQFHIHIRNQKPRERPRNLEKYYFQQTLDPAYYKWFSLSEQ